jgi:hypothetical protein
MGNTRVFLDVAGNLLLADYTCGCEAVSTANPGGAASAVAKVIKDAYSKMLMLPTLLRPAIYGWMSRSVVV